MSEHTWAIIAIIAYALLSYGGTLVRPRKCSEHATAEEQYKDAVRAPFVAIASTAIFIALIWAVNVVFFQ